MTVNDLIQAIRQTGDEQDQDYCPGWWFDCEYPNASTLDLTVDLERVVEILNAKQAQQREQ